MKLEDRFAGLAMQTLLMKNENKDKLPLTIARESYEMAEAMLVARKEVRKKRNIQKTQCDDGALFF